MIFLLFFGFIRTATTKCPENQVNTPCGFVSIFSDCGLSSTNLALFTAGFKTNITMAKRCDEGENCVCGKDLVLDSSTQKCRKRTDIDADCFTLLKKLLTTSVQMAPKIADNLVAICKNQEAFAPSGVDREFICAKGSLVAQEKSFDAQESRCFCGRDDLGSYNGSCVKRVEAAAQCAASTNTTLCATNRIPSTAECVKVKKFKCRAKAGTGTATSETVCKIGQCYCPDGFVEKADGKCLTLKDAIQSCTDAFVQTNHSCAAKETLLPCQQSELTFMGCTPAVPPERSLMLPILVRMVHENCRQENELRCSCALGFVRHSSSNKCISATDAEALCHS